MRESIKTKIWNDNWIEIDLMRAVGGYNIHTMVSTESLS